MTRSKTVVYESKISKLETEPAALLTLGEKDETAVRLPE
jgi:hypothetical protein